VAPCLLLLRGVDPLLAPVVRELRLAGFCSEDRVVIAATCTATESLIPTRRVSLTRRSRPPIHVGGGGGSGDGSGSGIDSRSETKSSGNAYDCRSESKSDGRSSEKTQPLDELSCFDELLHIPFAGATSNDELINVLERALGRLGAAIPHSHRADSAAALAAFFAPRALRGRGAHLSGHTVALIAEAASRASAAETMTARTRTTPVLPSTSDTGPAVIEVTSANVRVALDGVERALIESPSGDDDKREPSYSTNGPYKSRQAERCCKN